MDTTALKNFAQVARRQLLAQVGARMEQVLTTDTAALREKQAIINQAVTRGLDPNVPLKPSGIPWLGDIPEHWEVRRLKTLLKSIDQGVSPQAEAGLAENGAWGVLKSGCTNHGVFRQAEHKRLPEGYPFSERIVVREGDVLVSRACGTPRLVGSTARVGRLNYNLILSDKNFRLNFLKDVCVDFCRSCYEFNVSDVGGSEYTMVSLVPSVLMTRSVSVLRSFALV